MTFTFSSSAPFLGGSAGQSAGSWLTPVCSLELRVPVRVSPLSLTGTGTSERKEGEFRGRAVVNLHQEGGKKEGSTCSCSYEKRV